MKKIFLPTLFLSLLMMGTVGCGDQSFSGINADEIKSDTIQDQEEFTSDNPTDTPLEDTSFGSIPQDYAFGGELQLHYLNDSTEVVIESLIGQAILAKTQKKQGVRIELGYPNQQSRFGY